MSLERPEIDQQELTELLKIGQQKINEIYEIWKSTPYLEGFSENRARKVAVILDNQKLFLEQSDCDVERTKIYELIQKIFTNFVPFDLVQIHPILRPQDHVFAKRLMFKSEPSVNALDMLSYYPPIDNSVEYGLVRHEVMAKTRKITRCCYADFEKPNFIDSFATELRNNFTREILKDLLINAGTVENNAKCMDYDEIYFSIHRLADYTYRKTLEGHGRDSVVMGLDVAKVLQEKYSFIIDIDLSDVKEVVLAGNIGCRWKVFVDPLFEPSTILTAKRPSQEDDMLDSYFYCPYVMLLRTLIDSEKFNPTYGIMSRYAKKLESSRFFGKIKFELKT